MLVRNTTFNLIGLGLPLLAAVGTIPALIHVLGSARFGVLTLIWAVVSYFGLFDLGLGRALTQQLSPRLTDPSRAGDIRPLVWTALMLITVLGLIAGAILWCGAGWVTGELVHSSQNQLETIRAFKAMAVALPFIVVTSGLRGILESLYAFKIINLIRLPLGIYTFVGPLVVVYWIKNDLAFIAAALTAGRVIGFFLYFYFAKQQLRQMTFTPSFRPAFVKCLLTMGGWMTVSNVISPLMTYLDRFVIGAVISLTAVAYYVTPNEVVMKISIIPMALTAVLFPRFASESTTDNQHTNDLFRRTVLFLLLCVLPVSLLLYVASGEILNLWVGPEFSRHSTSLLRIFAVGILASCLAQIPYTLIQGVGRPKITAMFHLVEFPLYIGLIYMAAKYFGITGVAVVWLLRIVLDAAALFYYAIRKLQLKNPLLGMRSGLLVTGLIGAAYASAWLEPLGLRVVVAVILFAGVGSLIWVRSFTREDRTLFLGKLGLKSLN